MSSPRSSAPCPSCSKPLPGPAQKNADGTLGPVGSFCSKRCQTIDLGRWLQGEYTLPCNGGDEVGLVDQAQDGYDY